ncbi:hypothetical protein MRX96_013019 [Rhipicephalus microplus]
MAHELAVADDDGFGAAVLFVRRRYGGDGAKMQEGGGGVQERMQRGRFMPRPWRDRRSFECSGAHHRLACLRAAALGLTAACSLVRTGAFFFRALEGRGDDAKRQRAAFFG